MIAYNLRKKADLTKSQEQAERESMEILRINQANEARRAREEAAREKRRRKKEKAERNAAQVDLDALNAIYGTRFRDGQQVIVRGHRYTVLSVQNGAHGSICAARKTGAFAAPMTPTP